MSTRTEKDRATAYDRAMGRPHMMDDISPVIEHVQYLKSRGVAQAWIADQAVTDQSTLTKILNGRQKRLTTAVANRILAVRLRDHDGGTGGLQLPSVGIARRLNALRCDGFTLSYLAGRLHRHVQHLSQWAAEMQPMAYASTHLAVRDLFDALAGVDPLTVGIAPAEAKRAATYGRKAGGAPSIYWDEDRLDDPDGFPDWTGVCGTPKGHHQHYRMGTPACEACNRARTEDRREYRREGSSRPNSHRRVADRWDDEILVRRLRADFEAWTAIEVMEAQYGSQISNLKVIARRDGWTHPAVQSVPRPAIAC